MDAMDASYIPPAWLVLALGDQRKYAGNAGYEDEIERTYRYDSFVQYHRQLAPGDVLLVKGPAGVVGMAQVEQVRSSPGTKEQRKCPVCRRTVAAETRCKNGHRFERPIVEQVDCTRFDAEFGSSYMRLEGISLERVREACPGLTMQMAIKPVDLRALLPHLAETNSAVAPWVSERFGVQLLDASDANGNGSAASGDGYAPLGRDERLEVSRQIRLRRGQQAFRNALRARYGDLCLVTGCALLDILEAAHISPYRSGSDHHVENGLLLRADVHTLFDLNLIGVDPATLRVSVHPAAAVAGYANLEGQSLRVGRHRPSRVALARRWEMFQHARGPQSQGELHKTRTA